MAVQYEVVMTSPFHCIHFPHKDGRAGPVVFFQDTPEAFFDELPRFQSVSALENGVSIVWPGRFVFVNSLHPKFAQMETINIIRRMLTYGHYNPRGYVPPINPWFNFCAGVYNDLLSRLRCAKILCLLKETGGEGPEKQGRPGRPENGLGRRRTRDRPRSKSRTSPYRGVSWHVYSHKWEVKIKVRGRQHYLGYFRSAYEGARAYDTFIRQERLCRQTNFPH